MQMHAPWRDEVFARLGEGLVVHAADGSILDCNPAAERILGLTQDRLAGRTSLDPRWAAVHEDGSPFPGDTHPAMVALATGEPVRNVVMGVLRPDGTYAWILVSAVPLTVTPGSQAAVVSSFTEITGEMDRAARMLKATVDSMLDPHVLFQAIRDENGVPVDVRFAEANDAAIAYVLRPRDEVIGSSARAVVRAAGRGDGTGLGPRGVDHRDAVRPRRGVTADAVGGSPPAAGHPGGPCRGVREFHLAGRD